MITLRNITLRRGVKVVLKEASLTLQPGEKVGLIGRNGAGKSSLFAMLTNRLHADAGDVEIPPRWRVGEVAQNMPETSDGATDYVLQGDLPLQTAQAALATAEAANDGHAMADAHLALDEAGAFDAPSRAQALLLGLGFKTAQLDAPVNSFSGGWRMRLQLARALMCPAELLLLDEPTNHLDLDALVWLEAWLKRFDGLLVVISHDREFLDAITRVTVHLDESTLTRYSGNYSAFEEMRAERMTLAAAAYGKQQDRMAHLQRFIDRFKAKASKAKQAQSRVKALARMERLAPVLTASDFNFEFREPQSLPNPMLSFDRLVCGYMTAPTAAEYGDLPPAGALPGFRRPGAGQAGAAPDSGRHGMTAPTAAEYGDLPPEGVLPGFGRPGAGQAGGAVPKSGRHGMTAPTAAEYGDLPPAGALPGFGRPGAGQAGGAVPKSGRHGLTAPTAAENGGLPPAGALPGFGRPGAGGRTPIVENVTRSVLAGQRIGILGANGQGKSTLVKTIAHALPPLSGTVTEGKGLVIGYFAQQELDVLQLDDGALMHMVRLARDIGPQAREQELRDYLGTFRFTGDMVNQAVGSLSGGEKARLVLAMLVWQRPNLLLLDEPTNHLDLTTREALSIALNEFDGTVMLVSHDRALLREVCDEFWLVTRGGVLPFDGDLDDYQRWLLDVSRATARGAEPPPVPKSAAAPPPPQLVAAPASKPKPAAAPNSPARGDDRRQAAQSRSLLANRTRPLRQEVQQIDARMEKLAAERAATEALLATGKRPGAELAEAGRRLNHIAAEVAVLEERWLALHSEIEAINAAG